MSNLETIVSMTAAGYGVGILPSNYTRKFYSDKLIPIPGAPEYKKPLCIAYRPENRNVRAIQVIVEAMKKLVQKETEAELKR
jgi:DNA-binding transcriptional LysR family regulator